MSDSPILSKMDALMKKHRGGAESPAPAAEAASTPPASSTERSLPPAGAWLPVLTQVIERGTPPAVTARAQPAREADDETFATEGASEPDAPDASAASPDGATPSPEPEPTLAREYEPQPPASPAPPIVSSELSEELMRELTPRLSEVMEKQLAAELRKNLDQTVATLLSQLDVNVREIVREAVAEKLKPPGDSSR